MLKLDDVHQAYGGSHILRGVSIEARVGEVTVVLGRNGVGKTTLLKSIMGVVPIRSGHITLNGKPVDRAPPYERVGAGIGYVPQGREILGRLTVEDNLRMGLATRAAAEKLEGGGSSAVGGKVTVKTGSGGFADAYLSIGPRGAGTYTVTAEAPWAPGIIPGTNKLTYTIIAVSNPDPLLAADPNKLLGGGGTPRCSPGTQAQTENPIDIATGNKYRAEADYRAEGPNPLRLSRYYNSQGTQPGSLGAKWRMFYDRSIIVSTTKAKGNTVTTARAVRADGASDLYTLTGSAWVAAPDVTARLESRGSGFRYTCDADEVEDYDSSGRLVSMALRGATFPQAITYNAQGRVQGVSDAFGRILTFGYDTIRRLVSVVDPAGGVYAYDYDAAGNLASVRSPDQVVRRFSYTDSSRPNALTVILDETGTQWASYTYDTRVACRRVPSRAAPARSRSPTTQTAAETSSTGAMPLGATASR